MVANIRSGPSPSGALYYNKEKVDKDKAEVLFGQKMLELFDKYGQWMVYLDLQTEKIASVYHKIRVNLLLIQTTHLFNMLVKMVQSR